MPTLQNACEQWLGKNLNVDNSLNVLELACKFRRKKLVEDVVFFVNDHREILKSEEWEERRSFFELEEVRAQIEAVP